MALNFSDSDQPVFTASDLVAYQRAHGYLPSIAPPALVIFGFQRSLIENVRRKWSTRQVRIFSSDLYLLKNTNYTVGVVTGFGAGAPAIAALVDQFSAFGVRRFASIGMAGGLQENLSAGSLVLSTGAIRGEGVTRHYLPEEESVEASQEMADGVGVILKKGNHPYFHGLTWTTDAPFRELRRDVLAYQQRGVLAVDMEAAAMYAVAKANGLPALAAFSISDSLAGGRWSMSGDLRPAQAGLSILFEAVLEFALASPA